MVKRKKKKKDASTTNELKKSSTDASATTSEIPCTPTRSNSSSSISSNNSDSDGDFLPSPLKRKRESGFEQGDLVFAKFNKFPYWPALFHSNCPKKKKANVYFFDYASLENKKTFAVSVKSIKPYRCAEKSDLIASGTEKYKEEYSSGVERALDYLQKRAVGKVHNFFEDVETTVSEEEDQSGHEEDLNNVEPIKTQNGGRRSDEGEAGNESEPESVASASNKPSFTSVLNAMEKKSKKKKKYFIFH
eukprot:TCONS_00032995-protein